MNIELGHFLSLSAILFGLGMVGALTRRNAIVIFMSIEMMLNARESCLRSVQFLPVGYDRPHLCLYGHGRCGMRSSCRSGYHPGHFPATRLQ